MGRDGQISRRRRGGEGGANRESRGAREVMRSGNERRRFWVEIHSKSFGVSHRLVKKRKKQ